MTPFTLASRFLRLCRSQLHAPVKAENLHVHSTRFTPNQITAGHSFTHPFTPFTHPLFTFPPLSIRGGNVSGSLHESPKMHPQNTTPMVATPPRGHTMLPAWFTTHTTGWACSHPACLNDTTEENGLTAHRVTSRAIAHLNTHHPGWKVRCTKCHTPQWNAEGRPTCFQCRR